MNTTTDPHGCPVCERLAHCRQGGDPGFIHEFPNSVLVLGDHQYHRGDAVLMLKAHVRELHEIEPAARARHFEELMLATDALVCALRPWKMNHACLGNRDPHVHWHLIPRYLEDPDHGTQPWLRASAFDRHRPSQAQSLALCAELRRYLQ